MFVGIQIFRVIFSMVNNTASFLLYLLSLEMNIYNTQKWEELKLC